MATRKISTETPKTPKTPIGAKPITEEIAAILRGLLYHDAAGGTAAQIDGALSRGLYLKVNDVLSALGGVWTRSAGAHIFAGVSKDDLASRVELAAETRQYIDQKKALGFFRTPEPFAQLLVSLVGVRPNDRVLEPSAGDGVFIRAVEAQVIGACIMAVELDRERASAIAKKHPMVSVRTMDFAWYRPIESFDVVLANPPYARRTALKHAAAALEMTSRLTGRGAIILPASAPDDTTAYGQALREQIHFTSAARGLASGWVKNPEGLFASEGTQVRTVTLFFGLTDDQVFAATEAVAAYEARR